MTEYDFTLALNLARDLRNYHDGVVAQIAGQAAAPQRDKILSLLGDMNDELEALEQYVAAESAESKIAVAKARLAAAQAELEAAQQQQG